MGGNKRRANDDEDEIEDDYEDGGFEAPTIQQETKTLSRQGPSGYQMPLDDKIDDKMGVDNI